MFTAFLVKGQSNDEIREEISRNSYTLPTPEILHRRESRKVPVNAKSFHGKSSRSFYGCLQCKQRKKKCDEGKPACLSCVKRNVQCEYSSSVVKRRPNAHYAKKDAGPGPATQQIQQPQAVPVELSSQTLAQHQRVVAQQKVQQRKNDDVWQAIEESITQTQMQAWSSSASSSAPEEEDEKLEDVDAFLNSILSGFTYGQAEDVASRSILEAVEPVRPQEVYAMDESQIIHNVEKRGDDDTLLWQLISDFKNHQGEITDEDLSKYVAPNDGDSPSVKAILNNFLRNSHRFSSQNLDELDRFYLEAFDTLVIEARSLSFSSSLEHDFAKIFLEMAKRNDAIAFAIVSFTAFFITNVSSVRGQNAMKRSLVIYGSNYSEFLTQKANTGTNNLSMAIEMAVTLILVSEIGLSAGDMTDWVQYHDLLRKLMSNHFGGVVEFARTLKHYDAKMSKLIMSNFFVHEALKFSKKKFNVSVDTLVKALDESRYGHFNEFDSVMGYCTGIHVYVARIREFSTKATSFPDAVFQEFDNDLLMEQPDPNSDIDGLSEENLELHLTFFEVQQISARLFLRLLFQRLDPWDEATQDLLHGLLSNMKVLLKSPMESRLVPAIVMAALTVSSSSEKRTVNSLITHLRSHNQYGQMLRACMLAEIIFDMGQGLQPHLAYKKTMDHLNWELSFYC